MPGRVFLLMIVLLCSGKLHAQTSTRECEDVIQRGYYYLFRFRPIEAMERYQVAINMAKELKNESLYAKALFGAGQATWYSGNFHQAADTVKLALQHFPKSNKIGIIGALRILSNIYDDIGDYENALKAVQEALALNQDKDEQNKILSLIQMGKLYKNIGDYETAQSYYTKAGAERPSIGEYPFRELNHCLGELYVAKGQLDSADYFYRQAFIGNPRSRIIRLRIGESFLLQQKPDSAFFYLDSLYRDTETAGDININAGARIGLGKVAQYKGDIKTALNWALKAFTIADQKDMYKYREEASGLLASLYEEAGDTKQALYYYKMNAALKKIASSDVFKGQLFAFRQKNQQAEQAAALQSLESDKKLAQRTMLIIGLLALFIIILLVLRHKNEKLRLKQRAAELEMQALRAQMNPHFIFNCLSAINHFILDNETDKASDYLTRFSRLMRMVLVNAGKESITLEEELDMLRLYLDMEQLRFKDAFEYSINLGPGVQPSMINVPWFILQPFCENAIWHGLLHKEGKGYLQLQLNRQKDQLVISIKDNGIGMEKAAQLKTKSTESMGQKLTAARLALFNKAKDTRSHFSIRDIKDHNGQTTGTEVILKINTRAAHD
jgi:tetratricopeptide (TPR) repeat protein